MKLKTLKTSGSLVAIAALIVLADQVTKWLVSTRLQLYEMWAPFPELERYFTITYTTNTGAAFGLFKEWGTFFIGVAIVVIITILFYQRQVQEEQWLLRAALGLQLGGATGNLIDRLRLGGHVVDFLDFKFFPVFNVADSAITVGVGLLALLMLLETRSEYRKAALPPKESQGAIDSPPNTV